MSLTARARQFARRLVPRGARAALSKLRRSLAGPPIFETELGAFRFVPDPNPKPRLTLVIPNFSRARAFGGASTGADAVKRIVAALRESGPLDLRVALTDPDPAPADPLIGPEDGAEILARRVKGADLPMREREVFVAYNWHCAANLVDALAAQAAHFGRALPLVYLIQEYEPGFLPFSADHLLIRWALEPGWPVHAVVNSSLLAEWLGRQGHVFEKTHVFEPTLNAALRPFLAGALDPSAPPRAKRVLVYGRPWDNRNCWPILRRGVEAWARRFPKQGDWEVVSAGVPHPPVSLAGGRRMRSVGKLTLPDYAAMLSTSAVGVSLMASPHPSYPPLEMAHFGMRTLANRFGPKDPAALHENLAPLRDPRPDTLAEMLAEACAAFEADPDAGPRAKSFMPDYAAGDPFPVAEAIAADLAPRLRN